MSDTTHLQLPLLAAAQAQKHVTHNEALLRLDAIVQLAVIDRDLTAPPADPSDGDRYIPATGATGAWAGWDLSIAWFVDGVWTRLVPSEGWRAWVDDEDVALVWDGAGWQRVEGSGGRELLTAARTYFVNAATGNDANDGLTGGTAFAMLQKAIDTAATLDLGTFDVTINLAAGTYAGAALKNLVGAGFVRIVGDTAIPGNVVLSNAGGGGNLLGGGANLPFVGRYAVRGVKFAGASAIGIYIAGYGAYLEMSDCEFGACNHHIRATNGATVNLVGNYSISGGAGRHYWAETQGTIREDGAFTVTIAGTPAFTGAFVDCREMSMVRHTGWTFSGAATGKRYDVSLNSVIQTAGGGAGYFPGNAAGTTATGGVYS